MRVVIAPDSFKGSIGAAEASDALAQGWLSERPDDDVICRPMADGGEGTLAAFAAAVPGARRMPVTVSGPHGRRVATFWLLLPDGTGLVELASTSGIEMLRDDLRPWDADTLGFGQAIAAALEFGVERLVLGIGSSASTDGGVGVLSALGARFTDAAGAPVVGGLRGLATVASIDISALRSLPPDGAVILPDVTNPLVGARGSAAVFGPQKGLDAAGVAAGDAALARFAALVLGALAERAGSCRLLPDRADNNRPVRQQTAGSVGAAVPGAGAAGGTGFALLVWGAQLTLGAPRVAELIGLAEAIGSADLVVAGEGSYDGQSAAGKAPTLVAHTAAAVGIPCALVAGRIAPEADVTGFAASVSLTALAGSAGASLADPAGWLRTAGARLAAGATRKQAEPRGRRGEGVPGAG